MAVAEPPRVLAKEILPEYITFEGIKIQWNKVPWNFIHPETGPVSIDTYSIWNPEHHAEIAHRLVTGERVALYMMGNFGVAEVRAKRKVEDPDIILDDIKQRNRMQNLVAFTHPSDIKDLIDIRRLPKVFKHLALDGEMEKVYSAGQVHAVLPGDETKIANAGLIRQDDKSVAFFWIPGHFGYENLYLEVKRRSKTGLLGGGSLNIHGQKPSFTTAELRDREMVRHPEWLTNIDFVIFDEIAEAGNIGRSHTQISFMQDPAQVIRIGSLTREKIAQHTGYDLVIAEGVKSASSLTPYNEINNAEIDRRVEEVLIQMARFQVAMGKSSRSSGPQM